MRKADPKIVRKLVEEGASYSEVARRLGVSRERIRQIARELGIRMTAADRRQEIVQAILSSDRLGKETDVKIADDFGLSKNSVHDLRHKFGIPAHGRLRKGTKMETAYEARVRGATWDEVARQVYGDDTTGWTACGRAGAWARRHKRPWPPFHGAKSRT